MVMESYENKIDQTKLRMMLVKILDLEQKNNKTKLKKDSEMVDEILRIILTESK